MEDRLTTLFSEFDRGTISRRHALGLAGGAFAGVAALASIPKAAGAAGVEISSAQEPQRCTTPVDLLRPGDVRPALPAAAHLHHRQPFDTGHAARAEEARRAHGRVPAELSELRQKFQN